MRYTISIVDDEETIRDSLDIVLSDEHDILLFADAEHFLSALDKKVPDLVLMDIGLPGMSGIEALALTKEKHPHLPVIMITAYEDVHMAIRSMKSGAFDFILKPINPDLLEMAIQKAISTIALRKEVQILQEKYLRDNQPCFIAKSKQIQDVMEFIRTVAKSPDTPIMILGETGTGKELIARAIHARSPVFQGPFIAVNCSAFPNELIESELFGYEKGAFTGAGLQGKKGLIEAAAHGTLFLDEVADMSMAGQAKLLRFLEDGQFYKVGGTRPHQVRVRVVSATNKDLQRMVDQGLFRKDLFFRLCVVKASIPSLGERKEDILPLARYFIVQFNEKFNKEVTHLSPEVREALLSHNFTGNIRELRNMIERAVLVSNSQTLSGRDLGLSLEPHSNTSTQDLKHQSASREALTERLDLASLLSDIEKEYMNNAMQTAGGNKSAAAGLLNMNHHTFRYKWDKHYPPKTD